MMRPSGKRRGADVRPGTILWEASPERMRTSGVHAYLTWLQSRGREFPDYHSLWRWSVDDPDGFWRSIWDYFEVGPTPPGPALADDRMPGASWFPGTTLNYAEQVLRRGAELGTAIVSHSETRDVVRLSRGELRELVHRAAAGLRRLGVGRGDVVAGYLPHVPEAVVGLLACASIGAIWTICPPDYGASGVLARLRQVRPKVVIGVDGYRYRGRDIPRLDVLATVAAELAAVPVVVRHLGTADDAPSGSVEWDALVASSPEVPRYEELPFDHPLWIVYSSGTTGPPKVFVHGHGGIVLEHHKALHLQHDIAAADRMLWHTSTGWMMWNLSIGGLMLGATLVGYDGDPHADDSQILWRIAEQEEVTRMSLGAAQIADLAARDFTTPHDVSRVKVLGATGAALSASAGAWVYRRLGDDVRLAPGSGGTEICSSFVGGSELLAVRAGRIPGRSLGVDVEALDDAGTPVRVAAGELVVRKPMPSMPVFLWGDRGHETYRRRYFADFPGQWRHGDWIEFFEDGSCNIIGRSDAALNRGGVRLGTAEFYAVFDQMAEISDSLVVHLDNEQDLLVALVVRSDAAGTLAPAVLAAIVEARLRDELSPRHVPDVVVEVSALPHTLTGKRLEVPIKRILSGHPIDRVVARDAVTNAGALDELERLSRTWTMGRRNGVGGDSEEGLQS